MKPLPAALKRLRSLLLPALWATAAGTLAPTAAANPLPADPWAQRALPCTTCHQPAGRERPEGYIPSIAGKPAGYLYQQLLNFRDGRRHQDTMVRQLEALDDAYLRQLAAHFERQRPAPALPAPAPSAEAARTAQRWVRQGDAALGVPACARCHGDALTGRPPHVPGLLGLPSGYLTAQLGAWRAGVRKARQPDCMAEIARKLPQEAIGDIARWLAAQPLPAAGTATGAPAGGAAVAAVAPGAGAGADTANDWPLACGAATATATTTATTTATATAPAPTAAGPSAAAAPTAARAETPAERGGYLALLGNCAGCHSTPGEAAYAGGRALATPFGTVFAGNLTPDAATGLGRWSADDFWQALHHGRSRDGRRLLPVFPYTSYTHVTRADSDALFAYLRSLPAVRRTAPASTLRFPYNTQAALAVWQWLYFRPASAPVAPNPADPVARGAYLVQGLGHCAACHAPRNAAGAPAADSSGGEMPAQSWFAPSLHPAPEHPRSAAELVQLLRDGQTARDATSGPMAAVVARSLQHWRADDLQAMAAYLSRLPPQPPAAPAEPAPAALRAEGARLYGRHCADCHGERGEGRPGAAPALAGNATVLQPTARNLVQLMRHGGFAPATAGQPLPHGMPHQGLGAAEMAAVATHVRQSWGHRASAVTELQVMRLE